METYIILLRGINVSGKNKLPMAELKALCESLGFTKVKTYIQSGNVVMLYPKLKDASEISNMLKHAIAKRFSYEVESIVLTIQQLKAIIEESPFLNIGNIDFSSCYITYLQTIPDMSKIEKLESIAYNSDKMIFMNDVVYIYCPEGYGKTKFSNTFIESKLKVCATTRNWKTTNTLLELAKE